MIFDFDYDKIFVNMFHNKNIHSFIHLQELLCPDKGHSGSGAYAGIGNTGHEVKL